MKYLLVFNPKAKRYSRAMEATLVKQAAQAPGRYRGRDLYNAAG